MVASNGNWPGSTGVTTTEIRSVHIGGFDTIVASNQELARIMLTDCLVDSDKKSLRLPKLVFSSNGQGISLAGTDPDFMNIMKQADIIHADGMSVVWASRLLSPYPLPERVATSDYFYVAAQIAQDNGLSFYMLGGREEQNAAVVRAISEMYPRLKIAGRQNGYFSRGDEDEICDRIVSSGADILWVGLGKPMQEHWSVRNREKLRGVGWVKTCGGLYSFLTGESKRAPEAVQKLGLEWLWRLAENPKRLGYRYLLSNPHSIYRLIRYTARR